MSLADKVEQLKQDKINAQNAENQKNDIARDKIVSAAFLKASKREDELASMLLNEGKFYMPLAEYNTEDSLAIIPRFMGANIRDRDAVAGIDLGCIERNEVFQSLTKDFEEAGYGFANMKVDWVDFAHSKKLRTVYFEADICPIAEPKTPKV
tara:strand:+ start:3015 stop:3470 length:456 start_codon:yes stop_codon:yes gene_type:complete